MNARLSGGKLHDHRLYGGNSAWCRASMPYPCYSLPLQPAEPPITGTQIATLPAGMAGRWCRLRVGVPGAGPWWAHVAFSDPTRAQIVRSLFLGRMRAGREGVWRETMLHVPAASATLALRIFGTAAAEATLSVAVLGRWQTAARLLWHGRHLVGFCLKGNPSGLAGRLRAVLGQAPARTGEAPPYAFWITACESAQPPPNPVPPLDIQAVVLGVSVPRISATLASLGGQTVAAPHAPCCIATAADWSQVAAEWVVVLQAGEVLAPYALAWFAATAAAQPSAHCLTADFDRLAPNGERADPVFLPGADTLLARSWLPAAGPCAARWRPLAHPALTATDARQVRHALMLRAGAALSHIPRILAHLPSDAPAVCARPAPLARDPVFAPRVVGLVPSLAASMHVVRCLQKILDMNAYPDFRVCLLLSAPQRANARVLRRLRALPRVDIINRTMHDFNYAAINNRGAQATRDADLLLLLNDDVAPVSPDWLDRMIAHMADPGVGIVGARLLYGNGMVQHEGVIMGLADLCEHAGRLRPGGDSGPHGIGLVSRDVSAVTAACLLVRASVYRDLGGMDEGFAIALNDVDFCLRARQDGWRIVYCADATLLHYESLSLGRHYAGGRAALEQLEVRRLRDRWANMIADDPCYNPQASLEPGREWQPAFCPRPALPRPAFPRDGHILATPPNLSAEDSGIQL